MDGAAADAEMPGCNGHMELCTRRFDEVTFPGTHNAMSNADDGWFNPNQQHPIVTQLENGIRALLLDTHYWMKDAYLCHGLCDAGNKPLAEALDEIALFLKGHPREVVALLFEDHISSEDTVAALEASGLAGRTFTSDAEGRWPTLGELVASGRQVFVSAQNAGPPPDWYHRQWDVAWDTDYGQLDVSKFDCEPNRGDPKNDLLLVNHWLGGKGPRSARAERANEASVLRARLQQCLDEAGRFPNFVAVDYYNIGDLFVAIDEINGV